jgi:hypothetical protein
VNKQKLIDLGLKYHFLNYVDHETPRTYFPHHHDCYTDAERLGDLRDSILELHTLLRAIYAEVDIV